MGINNAHERLIAWRHHFHRRPETAFNEQRTARHIAAELRAIGLEVEEGIGGTGVVGTLRRGTSGRAVALRAEMDGLTLTEVADREHGSTVPGVMHACGHDGHMAMLLGAASALVDAGDFNGAVRFIFQPAEEHGLGARAMLDDGLFTRFPVDAVYGLHNIPGLTAGHLHTRAGAVMAGEDNFVIRIHGRGGHASRPQDLVDPLIVAAEIITALQTVVSRSVDPLTPAVVSCTEITTDGTRNAVPSTVVISGDTRTFSNDVRALLERRMRSISENISAAHGAICDVTYLNSFQPTINDTRCATVATKVALDVAGANKTNGACAPIMASEDFAVYGTEVPACFVFLGNGTETGRGGTPLHSHDYDFNDDILQVGVDFYVALVHEELSA